MRKKVIFITGATGGIGFSITKKIIAENNLCCLFVRDYLKAKTLLSNNYKETVIISDYDMNDYAHDKKVVFKNEILSEVRSPEIYLVLSAFDINPIKPVKDITVNEISDNLAFNLKTQISILQNVMKYAQNQKSTMKIINIDSGASRQPIDGWALYCSAKSYLDMFLRVTAHENDIPLVSYDPGVVDTEMQQTIRNTSENQFSGVETFRGYYVKGELAHPDDIADDILLRYINNWTTKNIHERYTL